MRIHLKYIIISAFLLSAAGAWGQKSDIDSLQNLLNKSHDTGRVSITFQIGRSYWFRRNIPVATTYLLEAIKLSDQWKYYPYQINAINLLANAKLKLQQYDSAFYYLQLAIRKGKQRKDTVFLPVLYETYHNAYYELGDYKTSLQYALMAAEGYEVSEDPAIKNQAKFAFIAAGRIFRELGQYDKAIYYFEKAYDKAKQSSKILSVINALLNIATVYTLENKLEESKKIYDTVIVLDKDYLNHENSMYAHEGLGQIEIQQKNYNEAIKHFKKALKYAEEKSLINHRNNLLTGLGKALFLRRDYAEAESILTQSLGLSNAANDLKNIQASYAVLSQLKKEQGNYDQALRYFELSQQYKDSLINTERFRITNNLETLYRTQYKENQILQLQSENANDKVVLLRRKQMLFIAGGVLMLISFTFILYYRNNLHKQLVVRKEQQIQSEKINSLEKESKVIAMQSLVEGQEAERSRVARDIHDSLGSLLSIVKLRLSVLKKDHPQLAQNDMFVSTLEILDETLPELRRITHNLAPEVLTKIGLKEAILEFCSKIKTANSLHVTVQLYGLEERLKPTIESSLFRIVQELLQNVLKHSGASEVILQINVREEHLTLTIEDNGQGFDVNELKNRQSLGLAAIENRAISLNGFFYIDSQKNVGTTATVEIPLPVAS
ncbi:tetratricopeptide repeat protein [Segetibacter sp.]|jgi:two-component system NarL family sensor kinase|uniref:ATP-binding protein n=1 Tax=Segetibacter sp. TaxID=2231182 RepID=UPI002624BD0F|nr:tetratricopeptide repeat protein [Segetibacter sp.]MCW3081969.1 putative signal transduction histidine kinase [Segetibacter sp.]